MSRHGFKSDFLHFINKLSCTFFIWDTWDKFLASWIRNIKFKLPKSSIAPHFTPHIAILLVQTVLYTKEYSSQNFSVYLGINKLGFCSQLWPWPVRCTQQLSLASVFSVNISSSLWIETVSYYGFVQHKDSEDPTGDFRHYNLKNACTFP